MNLIYAVRAVYGLRDEGNSIRRGAWAPGWHVRVEIRPLVDSYGRERVLVLVGPGSPSRTTREDFCPTVADVLAEDWEVIDGRDL